MPLKTMKVRLYLINNRQPFMCDRLGVTYTLGQPHVHNLVLFLFVYIFTTYKYNKVVIEKQLKKEFIFISSEQEI